MFKSHHYTYEVIRGGISARRWPRLLSLWTTSVEYIMDDSRRAASCTRPSPTQPTLWTCRGSSNPVDSVTLSNSKARWLAQLDGSCRILRSTVGIVCVLLGSPPLASSYRKKSHCSGSTTINIVTGFYRENSAWESMWTLWQKTRLCSLS